MGALAIVIVAAIVGACDFAQGVAKRWRPTAWRAAAGIGPALVVAVVVGFAHALGAWRFSPGGPEWVLASFWVLPPRALRSAHGDQPGESADGGAQEHEQLHAVVELSGAIASAPDLEAALALIGEATARILDRDCAEVTLDAGGSVTRVAVGNPPVTAVGGLDRHPWLQPGDESGQAYRLPFVILATDPWLAPEVGAAWRMAGKHELLVLPMPVEQARLGYVAIWSPRERRGFAPDAVAGAAALVHHAALAVRNALLLRTERQRAGERAVLLRVTAAATASLEFYEVLNEIVLATLGVAGIECTAVEIWRPETDELEIAAQVTVEDWPGVDAPGTRYPVGYWERDRELLASREPFLLDLHHPELDSASRERMITAGTGSMLLVPIWLGDQCLGVLDFFARSTGAFGDSTLRLGTEIAAQTALAIHRARLLAAEHARANEWAILHRVSRAASSSLDMREVLTEIAEAGLAMPNAESCTILRWDRARREIVVEADIVVADWAESANAPGSRWTEDFWEITQHTITSGKAMILDINDPILAERERAEFAAFGLVSLAVIPIVREDERMGWLSFASRMRAAFTADTLRLGGEMAVQIGLAIQNARLLEAERQSAHDWAVLHRVSRAAITSLDRETLLAEIAQACFGVAGTECCTILTWDRATNELVVEADVASAAWPGTDKPGTRYPLVEHAAEHRAMTRQMPIIVDVDDPDLCVEDRQIMSDNGITSMVLIPIWLSGQAQGFVYLSSREHGVFTDNSVRLGAEIGAQIALAMHNAELLEKSRRHADEQASLLRVSRAIATGRDLATVMDEVALASLAIAGAECTEIELLLGSETETEVVASRFIPSWQHGATEVGRRVSLADWPLTRRVLTTLQPEILAPDSRELTAYERSILFEGDIQSVLALPMALDDRGLGLMCCYANAAHAFRRESILLGLDLATQGAIAIDRARLHAALKEQANTDGLTGLLNHRAIQERLDAELARAHRQDAPLALLMIDLNHFKEVNDSFGHQAGDRVLQRTAKLLNASVRAYDVVGRYGGDEFMVLLPGADIAEANTVAERIMDHASHARLTESDGGPAVNLAVGLAVYPAHAASRQDLIAVADHAMYQAKQRRRNRIVTGPLLLPTVAM